MAALVCAWLAVCLLVWQGAWQLVLHPVAQVGHTPAAPFEPVRFDAAATGSPRLTGWWIPSTQTPATAPTLLVLHDGSGNLGDTAALLDTMRTLNVNLFAIDYRGFGRSEGPHPTQARMQQDAEAALTYLNETRKLPAAHIIPYGIGSGAVLAAQLMLDHPGLPALIVQNPDPALAARAVQNRRITLVPTNLLLHDRFDIRANLPQVHQPKLLLAGVTDAAQVAPDAAFLRALPTPKVTVALPPADPVSQAPYLQQAVSRFLGEYLGS